ncbi:hypothetical protein IWQ56_000898 [Coemansia nantahalensis]|uniref:Uncharacterized protein n=1 Tax=Coemansia nantahalensis TaxID=2789366 RepID=A0ACC1K8L4_9FUNG|nr:hypothetical protein IWQ56_000898 [Coemansia nantahalensis]KAJ2775921.1 hypothetical protein IWQ57_000078 [Coemansia nantahalensis]
MAPVLPARAGRTLANGGSGPATGRRRQQARQPPRDTATHGLPEYLYERYTRLGYPPGVTLLIDAQTGHELSFADIKLHAETLATSLAAGLGVGPGASVAVLSRANIDILIVAIAAWTVCASVVVLPPDVLIGELHGILTAEHLPRAFFVSRDLLPVAQQTVAAIVPRESGREQPQFVVFGAGAGGPPPRDAGAGGPPPRDAGGAIHSIRDLYHMHRRSQPFARAPLTQSEAETHMAIVYYYYQRVGDGLTIASSPMSHRNVIDNYNSSLRRSPSLPSRQSPPARRDAAPPNRPATPHTPPRRPGADPSDPDEAAGDCVQALAFAVQRPHAAFRLHRTIMNIFCLGARYLFTHEFDPPRFAVAAARHAIACAELTSAEIQMLIAYLRGVGAASAAALLAPLRFVYTETSEAEEQLAAPLAELLPRVSIVRTRFGSYVEPLARSHP